MARRRLLRAIGPALLLAVGGAYAIASFNWCGPRRPAPPEVFAKLAGEGALEAGAARVALEPPWPVVIAGFGPPRKDATSAALPLHARAVVLQQGPLRVGLVSLELLLVPGAITDEIRARTGTLELDAVVVTATHSHSSLGGYDARLISQLAGTGRVRSDVEEAVISGAVAALEQAAARLQPASLSHATGKADGLVISRAAGLPPDTALTRLRIEGPSAPVAEVVIVSAHPAFRSPTEVSPDYPGWVSAALEADGGPVTLVLMGAVGNSSAAGKTAETYAAAITERLRGVSPRPAEPTLAFAAAAVGLPATDSSRLVPGIVRRAGNNFLCASSSSRAEVAVLQFGDLRWVMVPGEVTSVAATGLIAAADADRAVSLAGDYLGYIEAPSLVREGRGESHRQYFTPELAEVLTSAAKAAAAALPPSS